MVGFFIVAFVLASAVIGYESTLVAHVASQGGYCVVKGPVAFLGTCHRQQGMCPIG